MWPIHSVNHGVQGGAKNGATLSHCVMLKSIFCATLYIASFSSWCWIQFSDSIHVHYLLDSTQIASLSYLVSSAENGKLYSNCHFSSALKLHFGKLLSAKMHPAAFEIFQIFWGYIPSPFIGEATLSHTYMYLRLLQSLLNDGAARLVVVKCAITNTSQTPCDTTSIGCIQYKLGKPGLVWFC